MAGKKSSKKGGKKAGFLIALLVALITLPVLANRSEAADLTYGLDTIPTRTSAGFTCFSGCSDPGESIGVDLNNALSVIERNLSIPGYVVTWKGTRVLELGVLSGGYSGAAGVDAAQNDDGFAFLGLGGYVLGAIKADVVYAVDQTMQSNYGARFSVDMPMLGRNLVALTQAAWGQTGL